MGVLPLSSAVVTFSILLNKQRVVLLNWGWWKVEYHYLQFDWLAVKRISDSFLQFHVIKRQKSDYLKLQEMCLELWKLTLTGQFAGISLRTKSGINCRTVPKAFFALPPSNLPLCQPSLSKEVVFGAQRNPLIVLVGWQQSSSKSRQSP